MKMIGLVAIVASLINVSIPFQSRAETVLSARDLFDACTRADMDWISFCNGFIQASNDHAVRLGMACTPAGTTRTHLVEIFEYSAARLLVSQSELGDAAGLEVASAIIGAAFPCN
ncbi:hypothetical protein E2K80_14160 [Rhodophyticola sp. CCM32]|uniref:hypothetical protein n=1 Tax=Rhodophyticola sp. CCM32 TaxID=2916397 RepID=UPI00107F117C|nr:hypothetical protein [Rhodophyticola sp. CCM32]QBY01729.1 hypothetical protein E2K80_14160 [Rhodophyticola sp. CCM32]